MTKLKDTYKDGEITFKYNKDDWIIHDAERAKDGTYAMYLYKNFEGAEDPQNYIVIEFVRTLEYDFEDFIDSTSTREYLKEETVNDEEVKYFEITADNGAFNFDAYKKTSNGDVVFYAEYKNSEDAKAIRKMFESIEILHDYTEEYVGGMKYVTGAAIPYNGKSYPTYELAFADNVNVDGYCSSIAYGILTSNEIFTTAEGVSPETVLMEATANEFSMHKNDASSKEKSVSDIVKDPTDNSVYNILTLSDDDGVYMKMALKLQKISDNEYIYTKLSYMRETPLNPRAMEAFDELLSLYNIKETAE